MPDLPGPDNILRQTLPNGITVLIRENSDAQSVVIDGLLRAGAVYEQQHGLVNFLSAAMMRGTQRRDFATLHEELEGVGASLDIDSGVHHLLFDGKALAEDLPLLLDLLNDVLRYPSFPAAQVERLRGEMLTGLKLQQQNTRYMASKLFRQHAYPAHHPYHHGLSGEIETISAISLDDLRAFHAQQVGPQGMIVVIVGNVQANAALQAVADTLGDWHNPHQAPPPPLPDAPPITRPTIEHFPIAGKSQVDLLLGVVGPSRYADDFLTARLANNIFGVFGMFGRLGKVIREEQGLAYYSSSQLLGGHGPGAWRVSAGVDPSNVQQAVDSIRQQIARLLTEPVEADELEDNKLNITGSLPLSLESNEGVAAQIVAMESYGLGLDYLYRYSGAINSITAAQIQETMARYWSPDAFVLTSAGPEIAVPIASVLQ